MLTYPDCRGRHGIPRNEETDVGLLVSVLWVVPAPPSMAGTTLTTAFAGGPRAKPVLKLSRKGSATSIAQGGDHHGFDGVDAILGLIEYDGMR